MTEQQSTNIPAGEIYREKVLMAGHDLLSGLNDITFHNGGESLAFEVTHYGLEYVAENLRSIAERAQRSAATTIEALQQAEAGHAWMTSACAMRCANCGDSIDIEADEWRICRGWAEHTWCHLPNTRFPNATPEDEDADRASVIEEDEYAAYCIDRELAGGPWHGDSVELTFPDGRKVQGTWYVPGPAPLGAPIVLNWIVRDRRDVEVSPAGAHVSVIGLAEDTTDIWVSSLEDLAGGEKFAAGLGVPDDAAESTSVVGAEVSE
jgi:hypothetical protein